VIIADAAKVAELSRSARENLERAEMAEAALRLANIMYSAQVDELVRAVKENLERAVKAEASFMEFFRAVVASQYGGCNLECRVNGIEEAARFLGLVYRWNGAGGAWVPKEPTTT